jgi:hypothetical protein
VKKPEHLPYGRNPATTKRRRVRFTVTVDRAYYKKLGVRHVLRHGDRRQFTEY